MRRNETGILGWGSNFEERFIPDYGRLAEIIRAFKTTGLKIVLTSGSYDLIHIGHSTYLEKARELGDLLVVGVDSDEKVRRRKGKDRPVVPQDERMQLLCHQKSVDIVTLKNEEDERWALIQAVQPDVLVLSERTGYSDAEVAELQKFCGEVVVLESQATTSTTERVQSLVTGGAERLSTKLGERLPAVIQEIIEEVKQEA